jgi:4'-phosphopantetheinyl transferase
LEFSYGEHGKPALAGRWGAADLHFNMSHSRAVALCAVARGQQVGVDVEHPRDQVNFERIAERFFSLEEFEALMELPAPKRRRAFYNIWTRKEAYVKTRGDGIAAGLGTFSVSSTGPAELLRSDEGREEVERWRLLTLDLDGDYVAALCAEGRDWTLSTYQWADCS